MSNDSKDRLITTVELANLLQVPIDTIYAWRYRNQGPKGHKIGRHIRYRLAVVQDWIDQQPPR